MTTPDKQPLKPPFEAWWFSKDCPAKIAHTHREVAVKAWHARDAHIEELEAALKIAGEALEKIGRCECICNEQWGYCRCSSSFAIKATCDIVKTLSRDLPN